MSTSSSFTQYTYDLDFPGGPMVGQLILDSSQGVTDDVALAVLEALNAVPWVSGTAPQIALQKDVLTDVDSQATATTPPTFA